MTEVRPEGNRRIDRVLAEGYLDGLRELPLADVRAMRGEAEQEETDLSYLRRLIQGRTDIAGAELARRRGEGGSVVDALPRILGDEQRAPAHGLGRYTTVEPSRPDSHQRRLESLVADVDLSDVTNQSDEALRSVVERLGAEEATLSERRRQVQRVMDACSAEITRRYRDGEADVATVLSEATHDDVRP